MRKATLTVLLGILVGVPGLWNCFGTPRAAEAETSHSGVSSEEKYGGDESWDPDHDPDPFEGSVGLESRISHPVVLAGEPQDVYLYLALHAAELPASPRPAINLALVIDRSGSMASEDKLLFAKSAAEQLVGRLRADDRLSIVAYDDEITTLVPSTLVQDRDAFRSAIRALASGGSTDLNGGMVCGAEEVLEHFDGELLNRVLLISDGLANAGVVDPGAIQEHAVEFRERGVHISTMGMGVEYDENLLSGIAQHAGGAYYYVDEAESVGRHLDKEIDQLARVIARDPELRVDLADGVELVQLFGYASSRDGDSVVIPMSDMTSGEQRKVVLRLRVQGDPGETKALAKSWLDYREVSDGERRTLESAALQVVLTDSVEDVELAKDRVVLVKAEIVQNAVALDAAMKLQKKGLIDKARELLSARYRNSKTFNDTELDSAEVTRILNRMKQVMLELERTRSDPHARRDLQLRTQLRALGYAR